ncbi:MAG: phosphoribosylamine--glycine ligase, partial [Nitrososphaerales archaeon]
VSGNLKITAKSYELDVMKRRVLVVGSGGREHALGWKLSQSPCVEKVFYAPGNGGTENNIPLKPTDFDDMLKFAEERNCFTVVGPEEPLGKGIVDRFEERGLPVFGPDIGAAKLEASKAFAKDFMKKHGVPTAEYEVFEDPEEALEYVKAKGLPKVVKADGLAAGKGSLICSTFEEAKDAVDRVMVKREFGSAGDRVVVEEFMKGYEVSFIGISDGVDFTPLATSQDHKQVFDGDKGANTGGMGAYSPVPMVSEELYDTILEKVMRKTVDGMREDGRPLKGVLYAGLMIFDGSPSVLEYNCRFGDPETQPQLLRMKSDLLPYLEASVDGDLRSLGPIEWEAGSAVCVVMASGGYPGVYEKGKVIQGLDDAVRMKDVMVFHAGTARQGGEVVTNGGRVLGVTALGRDIREAVSKVYGAAEAVRFKGAHYRRDIGHRALGYLGGV